MTTLTELKKIAKSELTSYMQENGFELSKPFKYIQRGPEGIYYVIQFSLSYGENLKVSALCHTKEMDELIPRPFPDSVSDMVGGMLKPNCEVAYENGYIWEVASKYEAVDALEDIEKCIKEYAFPFFNSISDRNKLIDFIYSSMLVGNYKIVADKIASWKPEKTE